MGPSLSPKGRGHTVFNMKNYGDTTHPCGKLRLVEGYPYINLPSYATSCGTRTALLIFTFACPFFPLNLFSHYILLLLLLLLLLFYSI